MKDNKGNIINVGDFVEILSVTEESLKYLEPEYVKEIREAVGQKLEVHKNDEPDRVWVDLIGKSKNEDVCGHTLFLKSNQIFKI